MKFGIRSVTVATVVVASAALLPAPAQAASRGTAWSSGGTIFYTAARGAVNDVVITRSGNSVTIDDRVAINVGNGCVTVHGDRTKLRCYAESRLAQVSVYLNDKNDRLVNRTSVATLIQGDAGNDRLTGGAGADILVGGTGNDVLAGGSGRDILSGGTGNDNLSGGAGNDYFNTDAGRDVIRGGSGRDRVSYNGRSAAVYVDLDGARGDDGARGEGDSVGTDVEDVVGGAGSDRLTGNSGHNELLGGPGNDYLAGGKGHDILVGGSGNDTLRGDAGDDHLVGEQRYGGGNARARDSLNGGSSARRGDICVATKSTKMVSCEIRRKA